MANTNYTPPGRLGDPNMNVTTDPRTNPKISEFLKAMGMADMLNEFPEPATWSIESLTPYIAATDAAITGMYNGIDNELPGDADEPEIETSTQTIKGVDNNDIILYIYRPKAAQGPLPAVIYSHGGGMVNIHTDNKAHRRWIRSLACQGVVAIMTDFRNAYTAAGHNPFPAGLNDCASAVQHVAAHRADDTVTKAVARILRAELVVIDDIGLLPVSHDAAEGLYRIVDAAYEKRSIALSSNLHPAGFDELMLKTLATATVDRLLHHAHICQTSGDSIRLTQALNGKGVMPLH